MTASPRAKSTSGRRSTRICSGSVIAELLHPESRVWRLMRAYALKHGGPDGSQLMDVRAHHRLTSFSRTWNENTHGSEATCPALRACSGGYWWRSSAASLAMSVCAHHGAMRAVLDCRAAPPV